MYVRGVEMKGQVLRNVAFFDPRPENSLCSYVFEVEGGAKGEYVW